MSSARSITSSHGIFNYTMDFGGPNVISRRYEFKDDNLIIYEAVPDYDSGLVRVLPYTFQKK